MKTLATGFLCALVLVSVSGCSGGYSKAEDVMKQMVGAMDDISSALESVKDKDSAKAAAPKLEAAVDKMQDAKKKSEGIKLSSTEDEKLKKEYEPKLKEATTRMMKAGQSAALKCEGETSFMQAMEKMKKMK